MEGVFLLEPTPAASRDTRTGRCHSWLHRCPSRTLGPGCGPVLIRWPSTLAKESRAKTIKDPEGMKAAHVVSQVDVTVTAPKERKPRPF